MRNISLNETYEDIGFWCSCLAGPAQKPKNRKKRGMVNVFDIAFVRLRSPDLDRQEKFLTDFGLFTSERSAKALYMRGTDPFHHIHVTELGEPIFVGLAFHVMNEEVLQAASKLSGASPIQDVDEPGGGRRVVLQEPNGYQIELIHGMAQLEPIEVEPNTMNWREHRYSRVGEVKSLKKGPSRVKRIGHVLLASPKQKETNQWFKETLGFIESDHFHGVNEPEEPIATFSRVNRGDDYVDHHVLACTKGPQAGLNHIGFEVQDFDDLALGHDHLIDRDEYDHVWGIGRHSAGSQIFDYWMDPWERVHEHNTDIDLLNVKNATNIMPISELRSQWGDLIPERFQQHVSV
jgi:catechol 2,3-dioxygenase-like lactoylglutathione lyase family enzyme|tara:strand:+ start:187 stop:1230 length:1044 start_codon:yes stop_codon:yes gene_type:complete